MKKLICILTVGATFGSVESAFADSFYDRGYHHNRHSGQYRDYDRYSYRHHDRRGFRESDRHHVVVVERPHVVRRSYIVEQRVYYSPPAPAANLGLGALIGAAVDAYMDRY